MGVSTDALLWWGYCTTDSEGGLPESVLEHMRKISPPDRDEDATDGFFEDVTNLLKGTGVSLVLHCHSDYLMYGLAIEESSQLAWRGDPQKVNMREPTELWLSMLREAAKKIGWESESGPTWWLASYWG